MRRFAIPEVIDPGKWVVQEGSGACDIRKKVLYCHDPINPYYSAIAVHELLHVRWSKEEVGGNCEQERYAIRLFEDIRVNQLGVDHGLGGVLMPMLVDLKRAPSLISNMYGVPFGIIRPTGDRRTVHIVQKYGDLIKLHKNSADEVKALAIQFAHEVNLYSLCLLPDEMSSRGIIHVPVPTINPVVPPVADATIEEMLPLFAPIEFIRSRMRSKDVRRPPRRADVGYRLKHPERIVTDKLCFSERRRQSVGTILIDCSGSMCIDPNQIREVARTTDGSTIVGYGSTNENANQGGMWILSEKGKVIETLPRRLSGFHTDTVYNSCDLPALVWLSKQKPPRVWVSDGRVNGLRGKELVGMAGVCFGVVRRYGINRFEDLDDLQEHLKKKR
jgi:hypothetical protein